MDAQQQDAERVTVDQKSKWDNSSRSYNDVAIRKGVMQPNARQVIAVVLKHFETNTNTGNRQARQ